MPQHEPAPSPVPDRRPWWWPFLALLSALIVVVTVDPTVVEVLDLILTRLVELVTAARGAA